MARFHTQKQGDAALSLGSWLSGGRGKATNSPQEAEWLPPSSAQVGGWEDKRGLPGGGDTEEAGAAETAGDKDGDHCSREQGLALGQNAVSGMCVVGP